MPLLITTGLWSAQITAINNLEQSSLRTAPRPHPNGHRQRQDLHRHHLIYRLIKFGGRDAYSFWSIAATLATRH